MVEPLTMLFTREFEDLHDDGFEGSLDEQRIFAEVFFGSEGGRKKGFIVPKATIMDCDYNKQTDMSLCSNSGKSSLTSEDDYAKEDVAVKHLLEIDHTSSVKNNREVQLSVGDIPSVKSDLGDTFIGSAPSGVISGISEENSDSARHLLTYRVVESSGQGITSSSYQLKPLVSRDKVCEIGRGSSKNKISSLDQNDQKEAGNKAVTSPVSQESYASKLVVNDPPVSVVNKLGTHRPTKPKWKDSCFLKLDEDELAMPKDIKNDPRPLLRYHINRLLRAAGWVIGRRKRNSKYNGIGEYVYKSPGGRPIREFHRAWCMCGESLLTDASYFLQTSDCMQWTDMSELWTDLSRTVEEVEDKLDLLDTSALAHLWCLLDPFANVVFIEKTIRLLKEGIAVKAKKSSVIPSDAGSAAKYRKISSSERSLLNSSSVQDWEYDGSNQIGVRLFDVPISSGAPQLLGGVETAFPHQDCSTSSQSFDRDKNAEGGSFSYTRKAHKKSRKISEMRVAGNHFDEMSNCLRGEISSARCGSKKSKSCGLNDDDLLISAIIKTKTCRATKKWSTRKSKPLRKRKNPKGSCRLLPRSLKKGAKHIMEGNWSAFGSRTVLSWLIHSGVVSVNEVIQYRNLKDDAVIKDGLVTRDGILCKCCSEVLSISEFKSHAGFRSNRPCVNLFMESGKPFTLCQLEAWSAEYKARKVAPQTGQVDEIDQNDDSCGRCGDVGELICCDNCPSAFHQTCLFEQDLPEGNWYCPQCRCQICGDAVNDKETSQLHGALKCSQCEHKYHETCMQQKGMKVWFASDTWFCEDSCHKVYTGLQSRIGLKTLLSDGFSWTLLRCIPGDQKVHSAPRVVALKAECNSKLAVAITIMEECFLPMLDIKTGIDMIPQVIYNWGSQFARLNYHGFYTVILEKDDVVLSVASIRIHGVTVAELPLVATCSKNRRQGMCRRLINSIEELLKSLKVEKLVISAIPTLVETWTVGFGFQPLEEDEKRSLSKTNLMVFPGAVWLKKPLYENHTAQETSEMGAYERGPTTEHAQLSDDYLCVQENNIEAGIGNGDPKNPQYCSEGNISRIPQNQPPKLSLDEQDPVPTGFNPCIKETSTTTQNTHVEPANVGPNDEKDSIILPNQLSKLDDQECELLSDYNNSFVEEANIMRETSYNDTENVQSIEKQNPVIFLNELSDCDFLHYPVSNISPEEQLVYVPARDQLDVVCGAEADGVHAETQRQICVHVEKNALEPEDEQ
ncbi:Increased DNA methylation 1 [Sesamum alatum]|uniref:Increased DNA methylation 1 n=1 Tax=Sesamum alatum TaxID=300844 RepID=A0AAE2CFM4_9LAMI|nr:Increased DNA methylation 1 [Sesamum alatum]